MLENVVRISSMFTTLLAFIVAFQARGNIVLISSQRNKMVFFPTFSWGFHS